MRSTIETMTTWWIPIKNNQTDLHTLILNRILKIIADRLKHSSRTFTFFPSGTTTLAIQILGWNKSKSYKVNDNVCNFFFSQISEYDKTPGLSARLLIAIADCSVVALKSNTLLSNSHNRYHKNRNPFVTVKLCFLCHRDLSVLKFSVINIALYAGVSEHLRVETQSLRD